MGHRLTFLRGWTRAPKAVGLPFASSPWTARRLAQAVLEAAIPGGGPVLELGAGTGPVTKALIDAGCPPEQIIVVEQDSELCQTLEQRLAGVRVLQANALALGDIRQRARVQSVSVVLSGLPMRIIAPEAAASCYTAAFGLMPPGRIDHPVHLRLPPTCRRRRDAGTRRAVRGARTAQRSSHGNLELSPVARPGPRPRDVRRMGKVPGTCRPAASASVARSKSLATPLPGWRGPVARLHATGVLLAGR